ncbi:uncharacterized protein BDR25DRAFT_300968 [Lindgomyces ingoldianus]|uniref:Uncharacterized protein n=1 Tax=Lindgomyces ingoldianus TaxID=673940 RepID=A0ACB6R752_9PLEO|nr:uncharacterized protein BDR25DRAFT_300968 [Lindgomyces ingoldianus]KAF2475129.1 hypothetical protein BDR25DRAFT_300968 [Lindgomyces ingoldianus]
MSYQPTNLPQSSVNHTWGQLLPSLNGLYDAQLDERFDMEDPITTSMAPQSAPVAVAILEKPKPSRPLERAHHHVKPKTSKKSESEPQHPTAIHSWSQLSLASTLSEEDFEARFAAEEEELTRAGIIKEPTSTADNNNAPSLPKDQDQTKKLACIVKNTRTPSDCVAAQIAWSSSRNASSNDHDIAIDDQFNDHFMNEEQELILANAIKQARTPSASVAAQISWSEARARAREVENMEPFQANYSWSQVLPSLSSAA